MRHARGPSEGQRPPATSQERLLGPSSMTLHPSPFFTHSTSIDPSAQQFTRFCIYPTFVIMPWKTLCNFPPTTQPVTLRIPNGRWRPDTVITDTDGNEIYVLLDQTNSMRTYEAIFGDLEGRKLCCVRRHITRAFWKDGYYFCTYRPNYPNQRPLIDRDVDNKKVFPFAYLQVFPVKGRFLYRVYDSKEELDPPRLVAQNPWLGYMSVCCTPVVRFGNWSAKFHKDSRRQAAVHVDQWTNTVEVAPGQDLLAALCMAYVFDRVQCQPMVTLMGDQDPEFEGDEPDDASIESTEDMEKKPIHVDMPPEQPPRKGLPASRQPAGAIAYEEPNSPEII